MPIFILGANIWDKHSLHSSFLLPLRLELSATETVLRNSLRENKICFQEVLNEKTLGIKEKSFYILVAVSPEGIQSSVVIVCFSNNIEKRLWLFHFWEKCYNVLMGYCLHITGSTICYKEV